MKMTLKEAVNNHRKLWHGIADDVRENGLYGRFSGRLKKDVMEKIFPEIEEGAVRNYCFLCQFVVDRDGSLQNCKSCPMRIGNASNCLNGLFSEFCEACYDGRTYDVIRMARKIAELPVVNPLYLKDGDNDENDA